MSHSPFSSGLKAAEEHLQLFIKTHSFYCRIQNTHTHKKKKKKKKKKKHSVLVINPLISSSKPHIFDFKRKKVR